MIGRTLNYMQMCEVFGGSPVVKKQFIYSF